ncbi:MAG: endolytic transglycosylase MltG [Myxococcales bacterium]|nr:MAG: endolytic transglycosylase MltG [Myxococcales bacterium]
MCRTVLWAKSNRLRMSRRLSRKNCVQIFSPVSIYRGSGCSLLGPDPRFTRPICQIFLQAVTDHFHIRHLKPSDFLYLRLFWGDSLAPGPHLLADNLTPRQLALRLTRDPERERVSITLPEGWHRLQIARRLHDRKVCTAQSFLDAASDPALLRELNIGGDSAEGYLFPATYPLAIDSDPKQVIRLFKAEFDRRLTRLKAAHPDGGPVRELGWTLQQVVTLASVVEREAAVDDERALVASAFLNRFRDPTFTPKPPRLQSDATTAYGCQILRERVPSCAAYTGRVTPDMNGDALNPYSTYAHPGLPPGPIANPGERSLQAAIAPADTKFLYFVGKGGGRHAFSETLAEHNAAVQRLRELPATRPAPTTTAPR